MAASEYSFLTYKDELGIGLLKKCLMGLGGPNVIYTGDAKQHRPLHLAVENEHCDCIDPLVEAGASLNPKDVDGNTPLHLATNKIECFEKLMSHGPNTAILNNAGQHIWDRIKDKSWTAKQPYLAQLYWKNHAIQSRKAISGSAQQSNGMLDYAVDGFATTVYLRPMLRGPARTQAKFGTPI